MAERVESVSSPPATVPEAVPVVGPERWACAAAAGAVAEFRRMERARLDKPIAIAVPLRPQTAGPAARPPIRLDLGPLLSAMRSRPMRMLKRFSLLVAIALCTCLLAPTGEAQDVGGAASFPSMGVSFNQTSTMGLASPTLVGRNNPLYASSRCCDENDYSCCPPASPPDDPEDSVSLEPQCFDLAGLDAPGVASVFDDNPLHASSHCCNKSNKSCCPGVTGPRPNPNPTTSPDWSQDPHEVVMRDVERRPISSILPGGDSVQIFASYCCNPVWRVYTCCAPNTDDSGDGGLNMWRKGGEIFGRFTAVPSGAVQVSIAGDPRALAACLK